MNEALSTFDQLLKIATRGVEIAIEKDEQSAEKWMNEEIEGLGVEENE